MFATINKEPEYQEAEIKKIVIDNIYQPLKISYKYREHGDGVDIPTESIKFCNADNGTDVVLLNTFNFGDIRKACYEDAKEKIKNSLPSSP